MFSCWVEIMINDSAGLFFFFFFFPSSFSQRLPDDSLSVDPCSASARQTVAAGHCFLTLLARNVKTTV